MAEDLKKMYRTIVDDHFPSQMEISFIEGSHRQTLLYEKVLWTIDAVQKGLRYGENPGQEAALYKMINGNLVLGEAESIQPGKYLASDIELLQSGKHPGQTNLTDAGAKGLGGGFLSRPAGRQRRKPSMGVGQFAFGVDTVQEARAMSLKDGLDAADLDDVNAHGQHNTPYGLG